MISQHFSLGIRQVKDVHMHCRPKFRLICYKTASAEEKVVFHCLTLLLYVTGTSSRPLLRHNEIVRQPVGYMAQKLTSILKYIK